MTEVRYGDWIEEELLGEGAFAEVHRARHAVSGQLAALKVLREEWRARHALRSRFRDEAETSELIGQGASRIGSLPMYLGSDTDGDVPWIAVEFIKGRALGDVMLDGRLPAGRMVPRDPEKRLAWARDVGVALCEALAYAHRRGIVHRDVKPENLLCAEDGRVVVIDFGIARDARGKRHTREDMPSPMTPEYAAPELLESRVEEALENALDTYAVGCVLYELITGDLPPVGTATTSSGSVWVPRSAPLDLGDGAPDEIRRLVHACTATQAALRPSMGAIVAILKGADIGAAILPPGASRAPPAPADDLGRVGAVPQQQEQPGPALSSPTLAAHDPVSGTLVADETAGSSSGAAGLGASGGAGAAAPPPPAPAPAGGGAGGAVPRGGMTELEDMSFRTPVPWIPIALGGILLLAGVCVGFLGTMSGEETADVPLAPEPVEVAADEVIEEPPAAEVVETPAEPAKAEPAREEPPARREPTPERKVVAPPTPPERTVEAPPPEPQPEPVEPEPTPEPVVEAEPDKQIPPYPETPSAFPPTSDAGFRTYALEAAGSGDRAAFQQLADHIAENPAKAREVLTASTARQIVEASMAFDRLPYPKAGATDVIASFMPDTNNLTCEQAKTWLRWTYGRRANSASSSDFYKKWCRICTAKHPDPEVAHGGECMSMKDHRWINGRCVHKDVELFPMECP